MALGNSVKMARTVQYASTRSEVWRWYWRAWWKRLWVFHVVVFLSVCGVVLLLLWTNDLVRPANVVLAVAGGLVAIVWMPLFPIIQFKPQTRTLTLEERGITTALGSKSAVPTWGQIRSVADEDGAIVIVGKNENAFIIPARAFVSEAERAEFLDYAKRAFQAAHVPAS